MAEVLGFALVALLAFYVVWPLLTRRSTWAASARAGDQLSDLLSRRDTLYRQIADLDFDHRVGKVDDADFEQQRGDYLDDAAFVLQQVDDASTGLQPASPTRLELEIEEEIRRLRTRGRRR
jgi:hypothetical protein